MSSLESVLQSALTTALNAQRELTASTPQLDQAITNSKARGIPPIAISPSQGANLSILCQSINAKNILEIGTLGGYSTIWFATSVPGVEVISIEYNSKHRDVALENLEGLDNAQIVLGAALDVLPNLEEQGKVFDFVFIDADWDEQKEYFDYAVKLTRPKGLIYVDNVVRQLTEAEGDGSTKGRALLEHVKQDERVQACLIPTLATHKSALSETIDGYLLAIVK